MFFHTKRFQYNARPDNPDPVFAMGVSLGTQKEGATLSRLVG